MFIFCFIIIDLSLIEIRKYNVHATAKLYTAATIHFLMQYSALPSDKSNRREDHYYVFQHNIYSHQTKVHEEYKIKEIPVVQWNILT